MAAGESVRSQMVEFPCLRVEHSCEEQHRGARPVWVLCSGFESADRALSRRRWSVRGTRFPRTHPASRAFTAATTAKACAPHDLAHSAAEPRSQLDARCRPTTPPTRRVGSAAWRYGRAKVRRARCTTVESTLHRACSRSSGGTLDWCCHYIGFMLPLPGIYMFELLLELEDTRLEAGRAGCNPGGPASPSLSLRSCYMGDGSATNPGCRQLSPVSPNVSSDGEAANRYHTCMLACNERCSAPVLRHEKVPLRSHQITARGDSFLASAAARSVCIGRDALGEGAWVDPIAACEPAHGLLQHFGGDTTRCVDSVFDCSRLLARPNARDLLRSICSTQWRWRPFRCALRPVFAVSGGSKPESMHAVTTDTTYIKQSRQHIH